MALRKRVVIVGAGSCGLVALKEHLESGSDVVCLEKATEVGGVFSKRPDACYDGLYLTISNVFMSFSDYPWPAEQIRYSPKEDYADYLELYTDHFNLKKHIKFGTSVKSAKRTAEGTWVIETVATGSEAGTTYEADVLVVANGSNSSKKSLDSLAPGFTGPKLHSQDFQNAAPYKGKHVLVVGTGESATDISADLAEAGAASTTVWARRPFLIAPRFPELIQKDTTHDEYDLMGDEAQWSKVPMTEFLEFVNTSKIFNMCPLWLWSFLRQSFWEVCQAPKSTSAPAFRTLSMWSQLLWKDATSSTVKSRAYWQADQAAFATKNSRIASMVAKDAVRLVLATDAKFSESSVTFSNVTADGAVRIDPPEERTLDHIDLIVGCVGYETRVDFLDPKALGIELDPRTWYKHCFPPGYADGSLAFVGYARPHQGGIPQVAELLARYHALVVTGAKKLPANYESIALEEGAAETNYFFLSPKLKSLVDYPGFATSVARLIGCEPRMPNPLFSPAMFVKYWIYPLWPCWFRLRGPGANKASAMTVLRDRFPLSKMGPIPPPPFIISAIVVPVQLAMNLVTHLLKAGTKGASLGAHFLWNRSKMYILHGNTVF